MKLVSIQEFTQPHFERVTDTIMAMDWKNPLVYGDFLAQTYHHICHSTRLLALAGAHFGVDQDDLHLRCIRHAVEERSHEKLSISDIAEIGLSMDQFPELGATKALYRSAYYLIDYVSPLTLFGYAYFLERLGEVCPKVESKLVPIYGKKAVKHLALHGKEDGDHIRQYEDTLNKFKGRDRAVLEESILTTAFNYERIYAEIAQRAAVSVRGHKKHLRVA